MPFQSSFLEKKTPTHLTITCIREPCAFLESSLASQFPEIFLYLGIQYLYLLNFYILCSLRKKSVVFV